MGVLNETDSMPSFCHVFFTLSTSTITYMENPPPSFPEIIDLRSIRRGSRGDFEHLLKYGGFSYHLLLQFNVAESECLENTALNKLYDAMSRDDGDASRRAIQRADEPGLSHCLKLSKKRLLHRIPASPDKTELGPPSSGCGPII